MAALPVEETSFILLLCADLEHALPDSDPEVVTALASYGAWNSSQALCGCMHIGSISTPPGLRPRRPSLATSEWRAAWNASELPDIIPTPFTLSPLADSERSRLGTVLRIQSALAPDSERSRIGTALEPHGLAATSGRNVALQAGVS
jgi:hypothetical protein